MTFKLGIELRNILIKKVENDFHTNYIFLRCRFHELLFHFDMLNIFSYTYLFNTSCICSFMGVRCQLLYLFILWQNDHIHVSKWRENYLSVTMSTNEKNYLNDNWNKLKTKADYNSAFCLCSQASLAYLGMRSSISFT